MALCGFPDFALAAETRVRLLVGSPTLPAFTSVDRLWAAFKFQSPVLKVQYHLSDVLNMSTCLWNARSTKNGFIAGTLLGFLNLAPERVRASCADLSQSVRLVAPSALHPDASAQETVVHIARTSFYDARARDKVRPPVSCDGVPTMRVMVRDLPSAVSIQ